MPSLRPHPKPAPPAAGLFQRLRAWSWPTQCMVCHQWQHDTVCADCQRAFAGPVLRCPRCALPWISRRPGDDTCSLCEAYPPEFDRAVAALDYAPPWTPLIGQLKFHEAPALAKPLARLLSAAVMRAGGRVSRHTLVLPTPLSRARQIERGYNQAALLARQVAADLRLRCVPGAVHKHVHTARLMSLSADERMTQIRGAFAVAPGHATMLAGRDVAVVDDVMTTGATLNELTRTLREAGVRSVSVWVLARTPPPQANAKAQEA